MSTRFDIIVLRYATLMSTEHTFLFFPAAIATTASNDEKMLQVTTRHITHDLEDDLQQRAGP